jgi:ribosomal 50S subunit-associated protein YjgA (DUF615 family)
VPDMHRLTPEEIASLRAKQRELQPIRMVIEKLKRIGTVDVSEHEARLDAIEQTRQGLLREFGNPAPGA